MGKAGNAGNDKMRKIDSKNHRRFITALEGMIRDMDEFGHADQADELIASRDELEGIYNAYYRKIKEVNKLIYTYHDLFGKKHLEYVAASRLRQKEQTRARHQEKKQQEQAGK